MHFYQPDDPQPKPDTEIIEENPIAFAYKSDRFPFFIIFDCIKLE